MALRHRKRPKEVVKQNPTLTEQVSVSKKRSYIWVILGIILIWNLAQWTLFSLQTSSDVEEVYYGLTYVVQFTNYLIYGDKYAGHTIHRQLKVPEGLREKFKHDYDPQFLNYHLAEKLIPHLPSEGKIQILDAGCGFGGTIFSLANHLSDRDIEFLGLNIDHQQISVAREKARSVCPDRCTFQARSFMDLEGTFDAIIFIESFYHTPDKYKLLMSLQSHLSPTGVLVIIEDMITGRSPETCMSNIQSFQYHWKVFGMTSSTDIVDNSDLSIVYKEDLYESFGVRRVENPEKTQILFIIYKLLQYVFWFGVCIPPLSNYFSIFCGCFAQQLAYYDGCLVYQFLILGHS